MDALTAMAVILDGQGRKDEARPYFEKALAIEPENKFLRTSYGQNLASTGRAAEAIDVFTSLTLDFPTDGQAWQLLGVTYAMVRDFDKAIDNLKQVLYIKPVPQTYYYLAMAYKEKGDLAEAVRYLERYLDDPKTSRRSECRTRGRGLKLCGRRRDDRISAVAHPLGHVAVPRSRHRARQLGAVRLHRNAGQRAVEYPFRNQCNLFIIKTIIGNTWPHEFNKLDIVQ